MDVAEAGREREGRWERVALALAVGLYTAVAAGILVLVAGLLGRWLGLDQVVLPIVITVGPLGPRALGRWRPTRYRNEGGAGPPKVVVNLRERPS